MTLFGVLKSGYLVSQKDILSLEYLTNNNIDNIIQYLNTKKIRYPAQSTGVFCDLDRGGNWGYYSFATFQKELLQLAGHVFLRHLYGILNEFLLGHSNRNIVILYHAG